MKWIKITYIAGALILLLLSKWAYDSYDYGEALIFSRDSQAVETIEKDDLFGTETTNTEWQDGFWLGLLPGDDEASIGAVLGVVPIGGALLGLAAVSLFLEFRNRKKTKKKNN